MNTKPILVALLLASCGSPTAAPGNPPTVAPTPVPVSLDGVYANPVVTAKTPANCPLVVPPTLTIAGSTVTLTGPNFTASGTASGGTVMINGRGRDFKGQVGPNGEITGRFEGPNCVYDVYWPRT